MEKYLKVLELMKTKGGKVEATDPDLTALLGGPVGQTGSVLYRLPTYMSFIRKFAKLEVTGIRNGRKVVAYELVAVAPVVGALVEEDLTVTV